MLAATAALALSLSGCATIAPQQRPEPQPYVPEYSRAEAQMIDFGQTIDGMWGLQTDAEMWLAVQEENCRVAHALGDGAPSTAMWVIPPQQPTSTLLSGEALVGAAAAASLISGCMETIDYSWDWPSFWAFVYAMAEQEPSGGGYIVQCNDGTLSDAGGTQGACSWHGGVDE